MTKRREIICEYQPYTDHPPATADDLYRQACTGDGVTVKSWRDTWLEQTKVNHKTHGPFKARGLGQLFGKHKLGPAIVVGSGPSLKLNAAGLKDNPGIPVVSCLHNFHFLEDLGVGADYYVTLDAGPVTVTEVSEGGAKTADEYWEISKDRTLIAFIGSHPELLAKWRGKIYFFNCPLPDAELLKEITAIEKFNTMVSTGGNVLGASTYIAKAILGCNPIAFMGADFSFSYSDAMYGWKSKKEDTVGPNHIRMTDVFGNSVKAWPSYANFKYWFDSTTMRVPGEWVNCSEGGILGAYPGGNIRSIKQMDLAAFLEQYKVHEHKRDQCEDPEVNVVKVLF